MHTFDQPETYTKHKFTPTVIQFIASFYCIPTFNMKITSLKIQKLIHLLVLMLPSQSYDFSSLSPDKYTLYYSEWYSKAIKEKFLSQTQASKVVQSTKHFAKTLPQ